MLSASVLQGLIDQYLVDDGARGPRRYRFSGCVARGVVNHFTGKHFKTSDRGIGTGGSGKGVGIKALVVPNMVDVAYNTMHRHGPRARSFLTAIMQAVEEHLRQATDLSTQNPQVGIGTGVVIVGSFDVNVGGLQALIEQELIEDGARGPKRNNIALAIATGIVTDVLAHGTGTVSINGSGIDPTSGTGNGTMA